jgi:hypothetical protein
MLVNWFQENYITVMDYMGIHSYYVKRKYLSVHAVVSKDSYFFLLFILIP